MINKVISPFFKENLRTDWKNRKFSIIVDESTDISSHKHLCILVRYFSKELEGVATRFLGLVSIPEASGELIFNAIEKEVKEFGQTLTNCVGFSSDGAANMVGCRNSVWSRLKMLSPNCVQLKCICHS